MFRYLSSISNYFMPPKKRTKFITTSEERGPITVDHMNDDTIAMIFSHFGPLELMSIRCACKKWREAAKKTIPAPVEFNVDSVNKYRAVVAMVTALPNLEDIKLSYFYLPPRDDDEYKFRSGSRTDRYADGEDPDEDYERYGEAINVTTHDVNIISRFRKLRRLDISTDLNGRYPALFNFPLLQRLEIDHDLKCDLSVLAGLPSLKELCCIGVTKMTGDLESLKVLKDNIEEVCLSNCFKVTGNFIILADFPRLKSLDVNATAVTGDIRDIGDNDFLNLDYLLLSDNVFGGQYHEFQSVSEVPSFIDTVAPILRRFWNEDWYWVLSEDSPDWYEYDDESILPAPPLGIYFVRAGPRVGWRWGSEDPEDPQREGVHAVSESCEINWLDPEPQRDSFGSNEEYAKYSDELKSIEERIRFYRGYHQPPTEDEYRFRCDEVIQLAQISTFLEQLHARHGGV